MADRKPKKKGKSEAPANNKLTKEEDSLARFIRFNCPTNSTMFEGNEVHYFSGKKAVDLLVESKKYGANAKVPKFSNEIQAEDFLQSLLERGLFFRAKKVVLKKKDKSERTEKKAHTHNGKDCCSQKSPMSPKSPKTKAEKAKEKTKETPKEGKKTEKAEKDDPETEQEEEVKEEAEKKEPEKQEEEKKKKKKVKLIAHDHQSFVVDPSDVYVWIFDPTPFYKKVIGLMMVLGTIAGCLFPLWPDWLRLGIYYLSVTGIVLFGVLLGMALARTILFGIIYACTMGKHKLWILPNLTEDCGFIESFKPFYTYEYCPNGAFGGTDGKKKSKDKKKSSEKANATGEEKTEEKNEAKSSTRQEKEPLLKGEKEKREESSKQSKKNRNKADNEKDSGGEEERISGEDSSEQEEDEEDENHPSDEVSDESEGSSSGNASDVSQSEASPNNLRQRKQKSGKPTNKKSNKGDGSPPADDDFVMVDSHEHQS